MKISLLKYKMEIWYRYRPPWYRKYGTGSWDRPQTFYILHQTISLKID